MVELDPEEKYSNYRDTWFKTYMGFIWAHYVMSGLAIILAAIVTGIKTSNSHPMAAEILGIILVIDTGLLGLFGAEKKANQAQRAWRIMDVALTRFRHGGSRDVEMLITAHNLGEDILHETQSPQPSHSTQTPPMPTGATAGSI